MNPKELREFIREKPTTELSEATGACTERTLLTAIETISVKAKESQMSPDYMEECRDDIDYLASAFGIPPVEAVLLSVCMLIGPTDVDSCDIARFLNVNKVAAIRYANSLDSLVKKRLLRVDGDSSYGNEDYSVSPPVYTALCNNEVYKQPELTNLTCIDVFEVIREWMRDFGSGVVMHKELAGDMRRLFHDNNHLQFCRAIVQLTLSNDDLLVLVYFCHALVNKDDEDVRYNEFKNLFSSERAFLNDRNRMRGGEHRLQTLGLIEFECDDGEVNTDSLHLSDKAKRELLSELHLTFDHNAHLAGVTQPEDIAERTLFYDDRVGRQVDELAGLLDEGRLAVIRRRMADKGFRSGFTCLFYGAPGTGKTETAMQLARRTGRAVMLVDIPQIKSKWVGDSEKNIKAVFDRYRALCGRSALTPVLLFNEADAVLGSRIEGTTHSVDKMENAIQNIILQEMETIEGIMIATTNLAQNLDGAFDRRFLYKIHFDKPDAAVRAKIWRVMVSELSEGDAALLAGRYDLSGGQIENVARKWTMNYILHGEAASLLDTLDGYCRDERPDNGTAKRVGF